MIILIIVAFIALPPIIIVSKIKKMRARNKNKEMQQTKKKNYSLVADELVKWKKLKDEGAITEREYEEMKKKLME